MSAWPSERDWNQKMVRGEGVKFSVLGASKVVGLVQVVEAMERVLFVTARLAGAILIRFLSLMGLLQWRRKSNAEAIVTEAILVTKGSFVSKFDLNIINTSKIFY